jgi:uncharacterized membrane protein YdjX (TVP38/TMEM64 family)
MTDRNRAENIDSNTTANINRKSYFWLIIITIIFLALIVLFFYLDRHNELSRIIRTWQPAGILLSILIIAALSMTPIPSEGFLILLFKIFGIYEALFYSWLGTILSALVIFYMAHHSGRSLFQKMINPRYIETVDQWVLEKGSIGLLFARLLPVPPFAINFIAGSISSIKFWSYIWTAALAILPYYIGCALIYVGVFRTTKYWLVIGGLIILTLWGISYSFSRISKKPSRKSRKLIENGQLKDEEKPQG